MTPCIFVINGPKRSGKTTAAEAIKRERNDYLIKPLAERMKTETLKVHGGDETAFDFYDDNKDVEMPMWGAHKTFRNAVIAHGSTMRDLFGEDYWITKWCTAISPLLELGMSAVIMSDCRFGVELAGAKSLGYPVLLMKPRRPGATWQGDIGEELNDVPYITLMNDRHIDDLKWEAYSAAFHFFKRAQKPIG